MVRLKSIKRDEKSISCEYCEENSDDYGYVKLDRTDNYKVIESILPKDWYSDYPSSHAVNRLKVLDSLPDDRMPSESVAIWY